MAGSLNDKFTRVTDSDTGRPVIATLASSKSVGATSVTIGDATNWTIITKVHFVIYNTVNVAGATVKDSSSQTEWLGTLSGTTISNMSLTGGTDRTYNAGAIVELTPTSKWAKDLFDGLIVAHNADGTLKANVINASNLLADGVITNTKLADSSITQSKIATSVFDAQGATASGTPTITSTTYADAPDAVTSITVTVPASGKLMVVFGGTFYNDTGGGRLQGMSYAVSGTNTIAAASYLNNEIRYKSQAPNGDTSMQRTVIHSGLTAGSTTFSLKFFSGPESGNRVYNRFIQVMLLP